MDGWADEDDDFFNDAALVGCDTMRTQTTVEASVSPPITEQTPVSSAPGFTGFAHPSKQAAWPPQTAGQPLCGD